MKTELLDKYRYINVDCNDWYEAVIDGFKQDMGKLGIEVLQVYFSEEGACFDGFVDNWDRFLTSLGYDSSVLIDHAFNYWRFECRHKGQFYGRHDEYSVNFGCEFIMPDSRTDPEDFIDWYSPYPLEDFRSKAWFSVLDQYAQVNFEYVVTEAFRDYMRDLHSRLTREYEYLTSDEAVWEFIITNGLDEEEVV